MHIFLNLAYYRYDARQHGPKCACGRDASPVASARLRVYAQRAFLHDS